MDYHLIWYLTLIVLLQVTTSTAQSGYCSCSGTGCTNIQVGYNTYLDNYCSSEQYLSETTCSSKLQQSGVWLVNYMPAYDSYSSECRIATCDTTSSLSKSYIGRRTYRKTCNTECLNYTVRHFDNCKAWVPSPAVLKLLEFNVDLKETCIGKCLPPVKSCIAIHDDYNNICEVYENVDTTSPPYCLLTDSYRVTFYVECFPTPECSAPSAISNGEVKHSDLTVSSTATYYCNTGFKLVGTATVTCQTDLQWSTLPTCQIVDCNSPPSVAYATISPTSFTTTFGSTVTYICNSGYTLAGSASISCLASGSWDSALPSCLIVDCNSPPIVAYAAISPSAFTTTYGSTVTYICNSGYILSGSSSISCLASGSWDSNLPSCLNVDCKSPPSVPFATISPSTFTTTYGSTVTYVCNSGYPLSGTSSISCLASGSWGSPLPSCEIVDCNTPPSVAHATLSSLKFTTTYGSTVTYICNSGYILSGSASISCLASGSWDSPLPSCEIVDCNTPPSVAYATVSPSTFTTKYGSTITYICNSGYILSGSTSILCLASGLWDNNVPSCLIVYCNSPPSVTNATISPSVFTTTFGSTVTYNCNTGYTLSGTASISCLASGAWNSPVPSCQIVDCGALPNVTDATVIASSTTYMSTASYTCASFYNMVGPTSVSCADNGQWGPTLPSCNIVDCQTPPSKPNATIHFKSTTYGSTASYICDTNFIMLGSLSILCQGDGTWAQTTAICLPKGTTVGVQPEPLYITSCLCKSVSYFINMTQDEIISKLISETKIDTKETTLAQSALICRQDNRTSSVIAGVVGIAVFSCIFGILFFLDILSLCKHFTKTDVK